MKRMIGTVATSLVLLGGGSRAGSAQDSSAAVLKDVLAGLTVSARVLMIGAHPDDENTQLLTFLARGRHVEAAYLSLTRGDGGQNAIGNELGDPLGAIRTEELLAARRLDAAHQYFTRAYDFGFSKTAEETLKHWPKDSVLRDVITVIRAYRPQVLLAVFSGTPSDGHGHHQLSGILAREAYEAAGDSVRFPASTTHGLPAWTPLKIYSGRSGGPGGVQMNAGEIDPILNRSYAAISNESRGQHKSQGFGTGGGRGGGAGGGAPVMISTRLEKSRVNDPTMPETSLFTGIDTTFNRFRSLVPNPAVLDSLVAALAEAQAVPASQRVEQIRALGRAQRLLSRVCVVGTQTPCADQFGRNGAPVPARADMRDLQVSRAVLDERINKAIVLAAGLAVEATVPLELVPVGSTASITTTVRNPNRVPMKYDVNPIALGGLIMEALTAVRLPGRAPPPLRTDSVSRYTVAMDIRATAKGARPWWLAVPRTTDIFGVPLLPPSSIPHRWDLSLIAEDRRPGAGSVDVRFDFDSATAYASFPIVARGVDSSGKGVVRPATHVPAISITLDRTLDFAPVALPYDRTVVVHLASASATRQQISVALTVPAGLTADSARRSVSVPAGQSRDVTFRVRGKVAAGTHTISAVATSNGIQFREGYTLVDYPHIRPQRLYAPSTLTVRAVDVAIPAGLTVVYIQGLSDNIPPILQGFGLPITVITPEQIATTDLTKFSTVVVGPRAYDSNPLMVASNSKLFEYVKNGGTMVVQYGQMMNRPGVMPFNVGPAGNQDRVTEEDSPVLFVDPASPILNTPNKIGPADFTGWVQERATYMPRPGARDTAYKPVIAMNDTGEQPLDGGILVARYGQGTYVYVTLALFRELPAGVPGAARLFMNLVAAGHPPK